MLDFMVGLPAVPFYVYAYPPRCAISGSVPTLLQSNTALICPRLRLCACPASGRIGTRSHRGHALDEACRARLAKMGCALPVGSMYQPIDPVHLLPWGLGGTELDNILQAERLKPRCDQMMSVH